MELKEVLKEIEYYKEECFYYGLGFKEYKNPYKQLEELETVIDNYLNYNYRSLI